MSSSNFPPHDSSSRPSSNLDVIIIGAGAAGLSAALWCDELNLKTNLFEASPEAGGQLLRIYNPIKNHLGADTENGRQMLDIFMRQIQNRAFELRLDTPIVQSDLVNKQVFLSNGEHIRARSLILATGVRRRQLNVPGEDEFKGRGVLESGARDYQTVAGKIVCVVGGGDAACENALILAEVAAQIYLVHRGSSFSARREFVEKVRSHPRVKVYFESQIVKISGREQVESVEVNSLNQESFQIEVDAVLIRIGVTPNTELFRQQIKLDSSSYILIDSAGQASVENVFAIGDVASPLSPTISTAVGMGATAAKTLAQKLKSKSQH